MYGRIVTINNTHKWMYPFFGERYLADVTNLAMKEFADHISTLKPATIRD